MALFTSNSFSKSISGMIGPIKNANQNWNLSAAFSWFQLHTICLNKPARHCYHIMVMPVLRKNSECFISLQQVSGSIFLKLGNYSCFAFGFSKISLHSHSDSETDSSSLWPVWGKSLLWRRLWNKTMHPHKGMPNSRWLWWSVQVFLRYHPRSFLPFSGHKVKKIALLSLNFSKWAVALMNPWLTDKFLFRKMFPSFQPQLHMFLISSGVLWSFAGNMLYPW